MQKLILGLVSLGLAIPSVNAQSKLETKVEKKD